MILYHGSFVAVNQPDLVHSRKNVDFDVAKKALYHDISLMKNHVKI